MNYFELFQLPVAPSVNRSLLTAKYFELQKKNHPDFFSTGTETEQEDSLKLSADINKAFGIFQNEQRTIEYFLQLSGLIAQDEKYNLPPEFLMDMMEINEALTEDDEDAVKKKVSAYETGLYNEVEPIIRNYDPASDAQTNLQKLKEFYYKKKYLKRILDRLGD